jgi:putative hemolysin
MSRTSSAPFLLVAMAAALAACASTSPEPTVNPGNRYQLVGKKNGENYYCQKQARTGSRANTQENCINQEMFEAYSKVGQDPMIQGPRSGGPLAGGQ